MSQYFISAVLLCRDRPDYLEGAVESIARQTLPEFHAIVSDNSSNADAADCNRKLVETVGRQRNIRYVRQSGELSMCQHCYLAISAYAGRSKWVAVHNDDDVWLPEHLAVAQASVLSRNATGLFIPNAFIINANGEQTGETISPESPPDGSWSTAKQMAFWCRTAWGAFPGFVIRTDVAKRVPAYEGQMVDVWLALWCLALGYSICYRAEPTLLYRRHSGQITETGQTILVDRHRMRLRMVLRHGAVFLPMYPGLFLKAIKSTLYLAFRTKHVKRSPAH